MLNDESSTLAMNPAKVTFNPGARIRRQTGLSSVSHFLRSWTPSSRDTINFVVSESMFGTNVAKGLALWLGWDDVDPSVRYDTSMKTPPNTPEFGRFTTAMRDILKVSKSEMNTRIEAHKETGKRLSKGSSSLGSAASSKIRSSIRGS